MPICFNRSSGLELILVFLQFNCWWLWTQDPHSDWCNKFQIWIHLRGEKRTLLVGTSDGATEREREIDVDIYIYTHGSTKGLFSSVLNWSLMCNSRRFTISLMIFQGATTTIYRGSLQPLVSVDFLIMISLSRGPVFLDDSLWISVLVGSNLYEATKQWNRNSPKMSQQTMSSV